MVSAKRRAATTRSKRLGLSSISASDANTPRARDAAPTKLWEQLPSACRYSVEDSPHLRLLHPPDGPGVAAPRDTENVGPCPSATPPKVADLSHVPKMSHHAVGFVDDAGPEGQQEFPPLPKATTVTTGCIQLLTPDMRMQRRRKALASGSFKNGAGALFSNTAHLDLELLGAPAPTASLESRSSNPIGVMLGMMACVCFGMLLQPSMVAAWSQITESYSSTTVRLEAPLQQSATLPALADRWPKPATWDTPRADLTAVCPVPVEVEADPIEPIVANTGIESKKKYNFILWNTVMVERAAVQAAAHEWSLRELSRLSYRLSLAEQERDSLQQERAANLDMLKTVLTMEMMEHRMRVALEQDVDWLEDELKALSQSEEESWCAMFAMPMPMPIPMLMPMPMQCAGVLLISMYN